MKKIHMLSIFLIAALLLTGCAAGPEQSPETLANAAPQHTEAAPTAAESPAVPDAAQPPAADPTAPAATAELTQAEAEQIALDHAGFTAGQVSYLHTEYEIDNGIPQYEVEFHQDRWEYDYEISAETGEILSYDRDD